MATDKHHPQLVVINGFGIYQFLNGWHQAVFRLQIFRNFQLPFLLPQYINCFVTCNGKKPGRWILRQAVYLPAVKSFQQGILHYIFGQLQVLEAKQFGEHSHQLSPFVAKEMFNGLLYVERIVQCNFFTSPPVPISSGRGELEDWIEFF